MSYHFFSRQFAFPHNSGLFWLSAEAWAAIVGTLILAVIAIWGDQLKKFLFKPNIRPIEFVRTSQRRTDGTADTYHRLIVKNVGSIVAKDVRVLLTYIQPKKNFIPVPLNWTHWNRTTRDISRGEPAYIDVLYKSPGETSYKFCWSYETGHPSEPILVSLDEEKKLRLEFFERDHKVGDMIFSYKKKSDQLIINTDRRGQASLS